MKKRYTFLFMMILLCTLLIPTTSVAFASDSSNGVNQMEMLAKYAPKVYFHKDEKYFPDSVENWFKHTELRYKTADTRKYKFEICYSGGIESSLVSKNVTADNLATFDYKGHKSSKDGNFFLKETNDTVRYGDNDGKVNAPVYAYFVESDNYYELTYKFWYPRNGNMADNIPFVDGASHQGDWEAITAFIRKDNKQMDSAIYNAHGDEHQYYMKSELQFVGTHPVVYSGKDSHASYALNVATKTDDHQWKIDRPGVTNPYCPDDHISDNGQTWETWNNIELLDGQNWLNYRGRWGAYSTEYKDGPYGPSAKMGSRVNSMNDNIIYYNRNNCIGNMRANVNASKDFTYNICGTKPSGMKSLSNDDVRSLRLIKMKKGTHIRIFDSSSGSKYDDYVDIYVKKDIPYSVKINTLESYRSDEYLLILPHPISGLDGCVSRIEVRHNVSVPEQNVIFYQGNNKTQNIVGTLDLTKNLTINLQNNIIENDEMRSLVIKDAKKGTLIRLYDSPNGSKSDDWVDIYVKKSTSRIQVNTFEMYHEDSYVMVVPHYYNGLDGKVSRVEVKRNVSAPSKSGMKDRNSVSQAKKVFRHIWGWFK